MELFKRLKLIEACISLQDHALIDLQLPLLKTLTDTPEVDAIIDRLEKHNYVQAQQKIAHILQSRQNIVLYEDAQISAIRLELNAYEKKLQELLLNRNEAQNRLEDFNREYHLNLGALLLRIFSLQEELAAQKLAEKLNRYHALHAQFHEIRTQIQPLKKRHQLLDEQLMTLDFMGADYDRLIDEYFSLNTEITELEEALEVIRQEVLKEHQTVKADEAYETHQQAKEQAHSFEQEYEEVKDVVVARLDGDEAKQLKALYRKICRLCHPDLVSDTLKEQAHELMVEVNTAYAAQDLSRLQRVLTQLEYGGKMERSSDVLSNKDALMTKLDELKARYQQIREELESYEASEEYQEVIALGDDWDSYFNNYRKELEAIAAQLEESLNAMSTENTVD